MFEIDIAVKREGKQEGSKKVWAKVEGCHEKWEVLEQSNDRFPKQLSEQALLCCSRAAAFEAGDAS